MQGQASQRERQHAKQEAERKTLAAEDKKPDKVVKARFYIFNTDKSNNLSKANLLKGVKNKDVGEKVVLNRKPSHEGTTCWTIKIKYLKFRQ